MPQKNPSKKRRQDLEESFSQELEDVTLFEKKQKNSDEDLDENLKKPHKYMLSAYKNFEKRLEKKYLKCEQLTSVEEIEKALDMCVSDYDKAQLDWIRWISWIAAPVGCFSMCWYHYHEVFEVPKNHFALVEVSSGSERHTEIFSPGYYFKDRFHKLISIHSFSELPRDRIIASEIGDLQIAIVEQGTIMHFDNGGQNIILGPGIHKITDPLTFIQVVSLDSFYIKIGPEKWVTIPDQYVGIASDLGRLRILQGGKQHHLPHVSDKFLKLVPLALQTDRIIEDVAGYLANRGKSGSKQVARIANEYDPKLFLRTTTKEGSQVTIDAMLFWRIVDVMKATKVMQIIDRDDKDNDKDQERYLDQATKDIDYLRGTILRFTKNYLTAKVGNSNLVGNPFSNIQKKLTRKADMDHASFDTSQDESKREYDKGEATSPEDDMDFKLFQILTNKKSNKNLKDKLNEELKVYGVEIKQMSVYDVIPPKEIQQQLDKAVQAQVDLTTVLIEKEKERRAMEITLKTEKLRKIELARLHEKEKIINAQAEQTTQFLLAEGKRRAIVEEAKGYEEEGRLLLNSPLAQQLAMTRALGEASAQFNSGNKTTSTYYLGENPLAQIFSMFKNIPTIPEMRKSKENKQSNIDTLDKEEEAPSSSIPTNN